MARNTHLYLQVDNIGDKRYISITQAPRSMTPGLATYMPGNGRTVMGGISVQF